MYNDKFAIPATEIRSMLIDEGVLTKQDFDDKIYWIYWELWHHEGRRARHGAAMSGPDYAWWHGIYDVANVITSYSIHYTKLYESANGRTVPTGMPESAATSATRPTRRTLMR